jgi:hypothetical protein
MAAVSTLLAATAVVGTVASIDQQKKAARQQERAFEAQTQMQERTFQAEKQRAEVQNIRSVRSQIRQARLAQANMTNVAAQTGGLFGSGLAGGTSSVGSQLAGNLNYMSAIAEQNTAIGMAQYEGGKAIGQAQLGAAKASSNAAIYGQIGSMAGTIFNQVYAPSPSPTTPAQAQRPGTSYANPSTIQMGNF